MPYATGRTFYDADSHIMEMEDWLPAYADPAVRGRLRPLDVTKAGPRDGRGPEEMEARRRDPALAATLESNLMGAKGWRALGAFDQAERIRALDLLGFQKQLVFTTYAPTQFDGGDPDVLYGGARAHNRGIADFCSCDSRLMAVGYVPLHDPRRAAEEASLAIRAGCRSILLPSAPPPEFSPSHPVYDGLWACLQDAGVPFMLHIGNNQEFIPASYDNNGLERGTDFLGGGENIRSKDYMAIACWPEMFLTAMVLDGVFERFPRLRGGCIELGSMWVIPWLRRLDLAQEIFWKTEPGLRLPMKPSEYVRRQLKFTPYPTEPVDWLIDQAGDELWMFSSDYPHAEGGRDPLKRFEAALAGAGEATKERFYATNFAGMMGI
jgi:predicted TIM-barrel fold metal-dependent hydrolase